MTDLASIFKSQPTAQSLSMNRNSLRYTPTSFASQRENAIKTTSIPFPPDSRRSSNEDFSISNESKKIITYDNLQEEAAWFENQNMLEYFIKLAIVGLLSIVLYWKEIFTFNAVISFFVFGFLLLGQQHCIFGSGGFKKWTYGSLIATTLVLVNQIFLHIMKKINPTLAFTLFNSYESLIPSIFITSLNTLIFNSLPLLTYPTPRSISENFLTYPRSLLELASVLNQLKFAILQCYLAMLLIGVIIGGAVAYQNEYYYDIEEMFSNKLNPHVILCEILTFLWFLLIIHFLLRIVSTSVSRLAIFALYSTKNKSTKVPIILELLRMSPSNFLFTNKLDFKQFNTSSLSKLLRFDFTLTQNRERKMNRDELENIYKHSLDWLRDLVSVNENALKTKITYSKFYHEYFDIFKEFAQGELTRCSSSLFELSKEIENLTVMRRFPKSIKEDLFYWGRVFVKQFKIWSKAVECCRHLAIMDQMIEIMEIGKIWDELWVSCPLGREISLISKRAEELGCCKILNGVIGNKMNFYYLKTKSIIRYHQ